MADEWAIPTNDGSNWPFAACGHDAHRLMYTPTNVTFKMPHGRIRGTDQWEMAGSNCPASTDDGTGA